ncbi:MAG: diguanylate cyclase [Polyangiales bacterium]
MSGFSECERHGISDEELRRRLSFFGFERTDQERLDRIRAAYEAELDSTIGAFLDHVATETALAPHLAESHRRATLRRHLRRYLRTLGKGIDRLDYVETRLRVGKTHALLGIAPSFYVGAFAKLEALLAQSLVRAEPGRAAELLVTLGRVVAFDLELALETYHASGREALLAKVQTDELTGVASRPYVVEGLTEMLAHSKGNGRPLTLLFVDLDRFKEINDRYGHARGDEVLRLVARGIRDALRPGDFVGRYGGDEFLVVVVDTDYAHAENIAERIRERVSKNLEGLPDAPTLSIGLANSAEVGSVDMLIALADQRMYAAKERAHVARRSEPPAV